MRLVALLLIASCGDALSVPDAAIPADDNRGLVSLTVRSNETPAWPGMVYFQNADSSLVLATRPRADGVANAFMAPGGFVTYVEDNIDVRSIYTFSGVQAGDQLTLDLTLDDIPKFSLDVSVTAELDPAGFFYELHTSCGSVDLGINPSSTEIFELHSQATFGGCPDQSTNVLLLGLTEQRQPIRYQHKYIPSSSVRFDANDYRIPVTVYTTLEGLPDPASISRLDVTRSVKLDDRPLFTQRSNLSPSERSAITALDVPEIAGATMITGVDLYRTLNVLGMQHIVEWGPTLAGNSYDYDELRLREYTSLPVFELTGRTLSWTEASDGQLAEAAYAFIEYFRPEGQTLWRLIAPRTAEPSLQFPLLPDAAINPRRDDFVHVLVLANMTASGGYDALRPALFDAWPLGVELPTIGPSGRLVFQTVNPGFISPEE